MFKKSPINQLHVATQDGEAAYASADAIPAQPANTRAPQNIATTSAEVVSADTLPLKLSLEFVWNASSTYWAGRIKLFDLYIDDKVSYTIHIPQSDERTSEQVSLPFQKFNTRRADIEYLLVKNLDTTRKLSLKAAIFNEKQGNTMRQNPNGTWRRDTYYTREDLPIKLDVSALQLGKHYKMIITHTMHRSFLGSRYWEGNDLSVTFEESGPCRQNTAVIIPAAITALAPMTDKSVDLKL